MSFFSLLFFFPTYPGIWSGGRDAPVQVTVDRGPRGDVLVAGDTEGFIRLYR